MIASLLSLFARPRTTSDAARDLANAGHAQHRAAVEAKLEILRAELAAGKHTTIAPREQVVAGARLKRMSYALRESAR